MTTFTGQFGTVKLGANLVAEIKQFEVTVEADTQDTTVMRATWKTNKASHKSWNGSMDVLYDSTDTNGQAVLVVGSTVNLLMYPSNDTTGSAELSGDAIVTSRAIKTSYDGMVEMSIQFLGTGALVEGLKV